MKKFNFKLQKVLDIRSKLAEEQKSRLSLAASKFQEVMHKKESAESRLSEAQQKSREQMLSNSCDIKQLQIMDIMQSNTDKLVRALAPEIEKTKKVMEEERRKYNKLHQEKRAVEILKEHALKQYKIAQQKSENKIMDEISKNLFNQHKNN